ADRVCLGLLPQSEAAWGLAAAVLRPEGGWCHVHGNVGERADGAHAWVQHVLSSFERHFAAQGRGRWAVRCHHVEQVKSYAPRVWHLVADIECRPAGAT
ncbi:unnamed protein product, partial [Phaeothamnion confervicola]